MNILPLPIVARVIVAVYVRPNARILFQKRQHGELSLEALKQAMVEAQLQAYGDAFDPKTLHPYTWAAWPHLFYSDPFYNFQYSFGTLFGLGLYGRYQEDSKDFRKSINAAK